LGYRWNRDLKGNPWESPYACFGDNPIVNPDPNGDKWGKPGNEKQQKEDKAHADKLKSSYNDLEKKYQKVADNLKAEMDKIENKTSDEYNTKLAEWNNANFAVGDMKSAQAEIETMEKDDKNWFTFKRVTLLTKNSNITADKNADGTNTISINYAFGEPSMKAHETKHGFQVTMGLLIPAYGSSNHTNKFSRTTLQSFVEREAYIRQFHIDPQSMPLFVNTWKDININYLRLIKNSDGTLTYPGIQ